MAVVTDTMAILVATIMVTGIVIIAACLKVFDGKPPVGVKVLIEGEEETAGHLDLIEWKIGFYRERLGRK